MNKFHTETVRLFVEDALSITRSPGKKAVYEAWLAEHPKPEPYKELPPRPHTVEMMTTPYVFHLYNQLELFGANELEHSCDADCTCHYQPEGD